MTLDPRGTRRRSLDFSFAELPALNPLMAKASVCRSQAELANVVVDHIGTLFHAPTRIVVLADETGQTAQASLVGIPDRAFESYETEWRAEDPLFATVLQQQVAMHDQQIFSDDVWKRTPIYQNFSRQFLQLYYYLSAPIYGGRGKLLGMMSVCRPQHCGPFGNADLRLATALTGHLSASLARLPSLIPAALRREVHLAPREYEVAALVAHGSNNREIAATLQIARETVKMTLRRVYRKLEVNGRAQMVARLAELGWL